MIWFFVFRVQSFVRMMHALILPALVVIVVVANLDKAMSLQLRNMKRFAMSQRRLQRHKCAGSSSSSFRLFSSGTGTDTDSQTSVSSLPPLPRPAFENEASEKYFEFGRLETDIYKWWDSSDYFKPAPDNGKKPYVIPMPPPNVTGYLHMGHAMFVALQDIMARYHRMRGKPTLWLPGTDHAGIATQLLVERELVKEGTTRKELGREKFLERVWKWKEEKGGVITGQMRRLGASADWTREKFTLDPSMSNAVTEAFVTMHERGLVYRGDYLVNWSPGLQTSVSDLEVDYVEEMGTMYTFNYPLSDGSGYIPVSTTRPETILGDSAVCVHPEDERYKKYIGKMMKVPFTDREIPVIADDYVDREFGTGALKVTPAHDINDYELGKKHNLPLINIMNKDATINDQGGIKYKNLDRFECREQLWEDMKNMNLVIKDEPHMQRVPRSQRGGEIIEPLVSGQWFIKMDNMASRAADVVRSGEVKIIPSRFEKVWYGWLDNIRPWCVSRQLWWGHRIPAYLVEGKSGEYIVARTEEDAYKQAKEKYGNDVILHQDEDVLDTWFSSGLWPFATVGWPINSGDNKNVNNDFSRFYPASVLETGYDILFFWVARMVMMGLELTDKAPFENIYMHGLVRDGKGQKMSKTTGNVIDPVDTIEKYGCDALRYSLVTGSTPGQDIPLSMERIESNRNFVNKLWNAGKFLQMNLADLDPIEKQSLAVKFTMTKEDIDKLPLAERYIVSRCHELVMTVTKSLEDYNFGDAGRQIQEFLWDEYADWFIEISKTKMNNNDDKVAVLQTKRVLVYVFDRCMRLLHPFMPFLTESLWQIMPHNGESIMVSDWPMMEKNLNDNLLVVDKNAVQTFSSLQSLVRSIRNARAEYNVEMGKKIGACVVVPTDEMKQYFQNEKAGLALLGRIDINELQIVSLEEFESQNMIEQLGKAVHLIIEDEGGNLPAGCTMETYLPMSSLVDSDKEIKRLTKQADKLKKDVEGLESRLTSKGFVDKAPEKILNEVKGNLAEKQEQLAAVLKGLKQYNL